jgi:membrane protease subunit HflK
MARYAHNRDAPPSEGGDDGDRPRRASGRGGSRRLGFEDAFKRGQRNLLHLLGKQPAGKALIVAGLGVLGAWLLSGIYTVQPEEQGVVLRFGAVSASSPPGIHYHLPWPIEAVLTPKVTSENQVNIGYQQSARGITSDVPDESLSLSGDENIVKIHFTLYWVIQDAAAFLFNVRNPGGQPDATIKAVAESAMREVVGKTAIEPILTVGREAVQNEVQALVQTVLNSYGAGVTITRVQMQEADPPAQVLDAYRDVQTARTDQERIRNEAEAYANKLLPETRGAAARVIQQAEGYKQQATMLAQGEAKRFVDILEQYKMAPDVTQKRIYIDTMQSILGGVNKVIIDNNATARTSEVP